MDDTWESFFLAMHAIGCYQYQYSMHAMHKTEQLQQWSNKEGFSFSSAFRVTNVQVLVRCSPFYLLVLGIDDVLYQYSVFLSQFAYRKARRDISRALLTHARIRAQQIDITRMYQSLGHPALDLTIPQSIHSEFKQSRLLNFSCHSLCLLLQLID